jgi:citrate lyase synthetase
LKTKGAFLSCVSSISTEKPTLSTFPFEDRIALVRAGTADLGNVAVLPSGRFIISSITFADYFDKAEMPFGTFQAPATSPCSQKR